MMVRLRYFIDYRYDEKVGRFLPIGIWIHNTVDGAVDIYYIDPDRMNTGMPFL